MMTKTIRTSTAYITKFVRHVACCYACHRDFAPNEDAFFIEHSRCGYHLVLCKECLDVLPELEVAWELMRE
jgi:hypothetical protein